MANIADQVARIAALFVGHPNAHGTHSEPTLDPNGLKWEIKSTAKTLRQPPTLALWRMHIEGTYPLGIIPIMPNGMCQWAAIDVDLYDVDLYEIIEKAAALSLVPCRSKSGGLHLFLFLKEPTPAKAVQLALRTTAAALGIGGSEIFPKQSAVLTDRGDLGNWLIVPYHGSTFKGKLRNQCGLTARGNELELGPWLVGAEATRTTLEDFTALVERTYPTIKRITSNQQTQGASAGDFAPRSRSSPGDFSDGPPCMQHLMAIGIPQGGRNNAMLMAGIYFRRADADGWRARLEEANNALEAPLPAVDILGIIRSLERKEYEYTCKTAPMVSFCNSTLCRTRTYGVGSSPTIENLSVLASDPRVWFLNVGEARLEVGTADLINFTRFQQVVMEQLHIVFPSMKQDAWTKVLATLTENVPVLETPRDLKRAGKFSELLEEFLTNRASGPTKEALFLRRPWDDREGGKYWFRMQDLEAFLRRESERDFPRSRCVTYIADMGGGSKYINVKGRGVNAWWVPSSALERTPLIDPPVIQESPI